jgi:hypothetical protein
VIPYVVPAISAHIYSLVLLSETPEVTGVEEKPERRKTSLQAALADGVASVFGGGKSEEEKKEKDLPRFSLSAVDNLLPKIRRGFIGEEEKDEDAMVVGWKNEVRSRKDREEVLRYVPSRVNPDSPLPTANLPQFLCFTLSSATRSTVSSLNSSNTLTGWKRVSRL